MSLSRHRLGPHEIVSTIGAGGMGEVIARAIRSSIATSRSRVPDLFASIPIG